MNRIVDAIIMVLLAVSIVIVNTGLNNLETEIIKLGQKQERLENDIKDLKEAVEILNNRTIERQE